MGVQSGRTHRWFEVAQLQLVTAKSVGRIKENVSARAQAWIGEFHTWHGETGAWGPASHRGDAPHSSLDRTGVGGAREVSLPHFFHPSRPLALAPPSPSPPASSRRSLSCCRSRPFSKACQLTTSVTRCAVAVALLHLSALGLLRSLCDYSRVARPLLTALVHSFPTNDRP